jgi:hypothetical protein
MFVCCECCVLLGRGLCEGLITRPEESYRLWRVVVCDQETSKTRTLKPAGCENTTTVGCNARKTNKRSYEINISPIKVDARLFLTKHYLLIKK